MTHVRVRLEGHLTSDSLAQSLAGAEPALEHSGRTGLVVDCQAMTGYDFSARTSFVSWNKRHRDQITRVAIVTDNTLWHMVISAMSLASRQKMKPFSSLDAAMDWAQQDQ